MYPHFDQSKVRPFTVPNPGSGIVPFQNEVLASASSSHQVTVMVPQKRVRVSDVSSPQVLSSVPQKRVFHKDSKKHATALLNPEELQSALFKRATTQVPNSTGFYEFVNARALDYLVENYDVLFDIANEDATYHNYTLNHLRMMQFLNRDGVMHNAYAPSKFQKRENVVGDVGLQSLSRRVRNLLAFGLYDDVDIVNSHVCCAVVLARRHNIPIPYIKQYANDPRGKRDELAAVNPHVHKDDIKQVYISLLNGLSEQSLDAKGINRTDFLEGYIHECRKFADKMAMTPEVQEKCQIRSDAHAKHTVFSGISDLYTDIEAEVLHMATDIMREQGAIQKGAPVAVPMFDGIMVGKTGKLDITSLNELVQEKYPDFKFKIKPIEIDDEIKVPDDVFDVNIVDYHQAVISAHKTRYFKKLNKRVTWAGMSEAANDLTPTATVHQRYLDLAPYVGNQTLMIASPMGTGKTYAVAQYLMRNLNKSVLVVGFRRTLTRKLERDFGLVNYQDIQGQIKSEDYPRVSVQINSLRKVSGRYDILILDEFVSTLHSAFSFCDNKKSTFEALESYIENTREVIVMDALLADKYVKYVDSIRAAAPAVVIKNTYEPERGVMLMDNHDAFLNDIRASLEADLKVVVAASSKSWADKLIGMHSERNYVYISSDTSEEELAAVTFDDAQLIVYTPTIVAGVSIDCQVDKVYAFFTSLSCDAVACTQMLGRARTVTDKTARVFVKDAANLYMPETDEELLEMFNEYRNLGSRCLSRIGFTEAEISRLQYCNFSERFKVNSLNEVLLSFLALKSRSNNRLSFELTRQLRKESYQVTWSAIDDVKRSVEEVKRDDDAILEYETNLFLGTQEELQDLTTPEDHIYQDLRKKRRKTREEKLRQSLYLAQKVLGVDLRVCEFEEYQKIKKHWSALAFREGYYKNRISDQAKEDYDVVIEELEKAVALDQVKSVALPEQMDDIETIELRAKDFKMRVTMAFQLARDLDIQGDLKTLDLDGCGEDSVTSLKDWFTEERVVAMKHLWKCKVKTNSTKSLMACANKVLEILLIKLVKGRRRQGKGKRATVLRTAPLIE